MILQFRYSHLIRPEPARLQPRKTPQQARSTATVDAIQTATIQVLLAGGVSRLTTTRVAERAGVSVGTMYQYYPHKQALLFAILERQLETVEDAVLAAAERLVGCDLRTIAHGLADAWLDAKTADITASRAIYGIAAEFDIAELMARGMRRLRDGIGRLLASAADARFADGDASAFMLMALLGGSVRAVMELGASEHDLACLRSELPRACYGYLQAASHEGVAKNAAGARRCSEGHEVSDDFRPLCEQQQEWRRMSDPLGVVEVGLACTTVTAYRGREHPGTRWIS